MKVLITGGEGQLGSCLKQYLQSLGYEVEAPGHGQLDITDPKSTDHFFQTFSPEAVVHCAAFSNVDQAEQQQETCWHTNVWGTSVIAEACRRHCAYMLYISTDYVFDGEKIGPYEVGDPVNPLSWYGKSKAEGEKVTLQASEANGILRTSWLFGGPQHNFVQSILRIAGKQRVIRVVDDQTGSPTYTEDLVRLIEEILRKRSRGIFHGTNEGICTWAEFAEQIIARAGLENEVIHIKSTEYPSPVTRPQNSTLSKKSLDQAGFCRLPHWQDGLKRYFEQNQCKRKN